MAVLVGAGVPDFRKTLNSGVPHSNLRAKIHFMAAQDSFGGQNADGAVLPEDAARGGPATALMPTEKARNKCARPQRLRTQTTGLADEGASELWLVFNDFCHGTFEDEEEEESEKCAGDAGDSMQRFR